MSWQVYFKKMSLFKKHKHKWLSFGGISVEIVNDCFIGEYCEVCGEVKILDWIIKKPVVIKLKQIIWLNNGIR